MHRLYADTLQFNIKGLNTHGVWYLQGALYQSLWDTEGGPYLLF